MGKQYADISDLKEGVDFEDISSVLSKYEEIHLLHLALSDYLKELEDVTKMFMNERKWTTYTDKNTKVAVTLKNTETKTVDMKMLKVIINEEQISKIVRKDKKSKIEIVTKDSIARLKNYGKK